MIGHAICHCPNTCCRTNNEEQTIAMSILHQSCLYKSSMKMCPLSFMFIMTISLNSLCSSTSSLLMCFHPCPCPSSSIYRNMYLYIYIYVRSHFGSSAMGRLRNRVKGPARASEGGGAPVAALKVAGKRCRTRKGTCDVCGEKLTSPGRGKSSGMNPQCYRGVARAQRKACKAGPEV